MASDNQPTTRLVSRGADSSAGSERGRSAPPAQSPTRRALPRSSVRTSTATRPDRFSRLFGQLPPFAENNMRVQSALRELGAKNGCSMPKTIWRRDRSASS